MRKIIRNSFFLFVLFSFSLKSQNKIVDYQLWNRIELKYKLDKKSFFSYQTGIRYVDNGSFKKRTFNDYNIKFQHHKTVSYNLGYRHIINKDISDFDLEKRHRIYVSFNLKKKISKKSILYSRTRFQKEKSLSNYEHTLRQKFKCSLVFKKLKMNYINSCEFFLDMNFLVEKIRLSSGLSKKINKKIDVDLSYIYENKSDFDILSSFHILRTKLTYSLN